jgi:hypothetical protein
LVALRDGRVCEDDHSDGGGVELKWCMREFEKVKELQDARSDEELAYGPFWAAGLTMRECR